MESTFENCKRGKINGLKSYTTFDHSEDYVIYLPNQRGIIISSSGKQ